VPLKVLSTSFSPFGFNDPICSASSLIVLPKVESVQEVFENTIRILTMISTNKHGHDNEDGNNNDKNVIGGDDVFGGGGGLGLG